MPPGTRDGEASRIQHSDRPASNDSPYGGCRVVRTGGIQAGDLARALSDGTATKPGANLTASCIESKPALVVLSNRTSFDLCSTVVPHGFNSEATRLVVAAVGGDPDSLLAATLADWLSQMLGVPACALYGHSDPSDLAHGEVFLRRTVARLPGMDVRTVDVSGPAAMVGALRAGTLLIVGPPGGSWFQRRFFRPGARIVVEAPSGAIVVNHNSTRTLRGHAVASRVWPEPACIGCSAAIGRIRRGGRRARETGRRHHAGVSLRSRRSVSGRGVIGEECSSSGAVFGHS